MLALLVLLACAEPTDERMWRYLNEDGRTVYANDRDRIPARFRSAAVPMDSPAQPTTFDTQAIYRFTDARGRHVYVNGIDRVPVERRGSAAQVDLSDASTNTQLGHDLDASLDDEWSRLVASDPCKRARAGAAAPWLATLWRENGHLLVLAFGLLVLLAVTPAAIRRFDAPSWSRVLAVAIPALAVVALFAHTVVRTNGVLRQARAAAAPCEPTAFSRVPAGPEGIAMRLGLVERLRAAVEAADIESGTRVYERRAR